MKKKSLLILMLALVLSIAMFMTACGGGQKESAKPDDNAGKQEQQTEAKTEESKAVTLEEYLQTNEDLKQTIISTAAESGMTMEFKGNEMIYNYDVSQVEGFTEDMIDNEVFRSAIEDGMESNKSVFANSSISVEKVTGIDGIITVLNYTYNGKAFISRSYTSADAE